MPIYEYGCGACGHKFEQQQSIKDDPLRVCPQCGKESLEKLIAPTAFVLKGGGWYKDGYGSKGSGRTENQRADRLQKAIDDDKKKSAAAESSASASTSSSSDTKASA